MSINREELSDRQRRNLASLHLVKDRVKKRYGDLVQVVTTDEQAIANSGTIAIPFKQLDNTKPLTIAMTLRDREGNETVTSRGDTEDLLTVLERMDDAISNKKAKQVERSVASKKQEPVKRETSEEFGKIKQARTPKVTAADLASLREALK